MNTTPEPSLILLLPGVAVLAAGVLLVLRGRRGVRRGATPHCRRCDYVLTGIDSGRCPECGADVRARGARVHGERVRQPRLVYGGLALVLLSLPLLNEGWFHVFRDFDAFRHKPMAWLIHDLRSPSGETASRAWAEILRRAEAAELSPGHRERLADVALAEQQAANVGPVTGALVYWLGEAVLAGKVSERQREQFFAHAVRLKLEVRPTVVLGEPVPYRITNEGRAPSPGEGWHYRIEYLGVSLDGRPALAGGGFTSGSGFGSGGSMTSLLPSRTAGHHTLTASARVQIYRGSIASGPRSADALMHEREIALSETVDVLPQAPADATAAGDAGDPDLGERIKLSIRPVDFAWTPARPGRSGSLSGSVRISSVPANVAFELFVRPSGGGAERRVGAVSIKRGGSARLNLGQSPLETPPGRRVDLVLRSSEKVARRTVDLSNIWHGELTFPNVPVTEVR